MMRMLRTLALVTVAAGLSGPTSASGQVPIPLPVTVWKSATCGCCAKWNEHMKAAGFSVTSTDVPDVAPFKDKHGVPPTTRSCHTALVGGYVLEGHVPADLVRRLLRERPQTVVGLAVPNMPLGSPGMEMPDGRKDTYNILAFDKSGKTTVYATR